jgi:hypothetical protein
VNNSRGKITCYDLSHQTYIEYIYQSATIGSPCNFVWNSLGAIGPWIIKGVYYLLEPCYKSSLNNLLGQKSFKRDRRIELSERYYYYYYYYS